METINHECYVSLEVAKLLKEAGFNWEVNHYYLTQNGKTEVKSDFRHPAQNYNEPMATMDSKSFEFEVCSRPSLDVAQRWFREEKNIAIDINSNKQGFYVFIARRINMEDYTLPSVLCISACNFNTYEEALENGLVVLLNNEKEETYGTKENS